MIEALKSALKFRLRIPVCGVLRSGVWRQSVPSGSVRRDKHAEDTRSAAFRLYARALP